MNRKCCDTPKGVGPHADWCVNRPGNPSPHTVLDLEADHAIKCIVCGRSPAYPTIRLCGPCATGEADFGGEP